MGFSIGDITAGVERFLEDPLGTKAAVGGLESALDIERGASADIKALLEQILSGTQPFRELAGEQVPLLRAEALAEPGTSPLFQQALQRGQTAIEQSFAPRGGAGGSQEAIASGRLTSNLLSADINRISGLRERLAGGSQTGFGQAAGLQGLLAQLAGMQAQTAAGMGTVTGAGRATVTQGLLDLLGKAVGGASTAATGGAGAAGI